MIPLLEGRGRAKVCVAHDVCIWLYLCLSQYNADSSHNILTYPLIIALHCHALPATNIENGKLGLHNTSYTFYLVLVKKTLYHLCIQKLYGAFFLLQLEQIKICINLASAVHQPRPPVLKSTLLYHNLIQGMVDGSASKPALRQDIGYMVEKTYLDIAPYLGAFGAYLMPQ